MNFAFPSSAQSVNFLKFVFAQARISQRRFRSCMLKIPEVSKPDLAAIRQSDLDFVDRVIAWMDRKAAYKAAYAEWDSKVERFCLEHEADVDFVEKNKREGVPF